MSLNTFDFSNIGDSKSEFEPNLFVSLNYYNFFNEIVIKFTSG
jgi:hypothetical protein